MPDIPYTQPREVQYRGPSTSDDYNARIEENYQDLVVLVNRARIAESQLQEYYARAVKDQLSLIQTIEDLETRIAAIEAAKKVLSFFQTSQIDTDRFNSGSFNISSVSRCSSDSRNGLITLPKVDSSSLSKLSFVDTNGDTQLPSTLESAIVGISPGIDSTGAIVDSTPPEFAIRGGTGRIWERNLIVNAADTTNHAQMTLYVKVPTDLFTTDKSNMLTIHPFPALGVDITDVALSTVANPVLTDVDGYTAINSTAHYSGQAAAIGWVPPGGWVGDTIVDAGPKKFYFDPLPVTAFRIKMRQRNYYQENGKFIYTYGASLLDLGYDKFLSTGKIILRFDAPTAGTISTVTSVLPQIYNIAESELSSVFSYRVIWETSLNSGSYTITPVALSKRIWVEVTLNAATGGGTPALSGLTVSYT